MKHSQSCFGNSCLGSRAVALKSGAAGLFPAVILTCFAAVQTARAGLTFQLLCEFNGTNGLNPLSGLVQGNDGNFYGTTYRGGAGYTDYSDARGGKGTVFRITPNGALTTLVSFDGWNGNKAKGALVQESDGSFYGTTQRGGVIDQGTVFKITTNGVVTTLYSFSNLDGRWPSGGMVQGNDGNLYGTTDLGGASDYGTVFQLMTNGALTTLFSFNGTNGRGPNGLVQGSDGNLYSTTVLGGAYGHGTIFKITTNGTLTTLFSFNGTDASQPKSLVQGSDGNFYGTTVEGGPYFAGTIFRLVQPPRPLITVITESGGIVALTWTSLTDGIYRVEYKPSLAATNWTALIPDVTATGSTASLTDGPGTDAERYYRITLQP